MSRASSAVGRSSVKPPEGSVAEPPRPYSWFSASERAPSAADGGGVARSAEAVLLVQRLRTRPERGRRRRRRPQLPRPYSWFSASERAPSAADAAASPAVPRPYSWFSASERAPSAADRGGVARSAEAVLLVQRLGTGPERGRPQRRRPQCRGRTPGSAPPNEPQARPTRRPRPQCRGRTPGSAPPNAPRAQPMRQRSTSP